MHVSPTGDILSRLSADTTQVSDLISQNVNIFLRSSIKGAGHFLFMCVMSWKLTLVTVTGFPFITFISKIYGDYYKVSPESVQQEEALRHPSVGSYRCPSPPETVQRGAGDSGRGQQSGRRDHLIHEDGAELR